MDDEVTTDIVIDDPEIIDDVVDHLTEDIVDAIGDADEESIVTDETITTEDVSEDGSGETVTDEGTADEVLDGQTATEDDTTDQTGDSTDTV